MTEKATFAAGCFWGVEELFQKQPGILFTQVGYTGGHTVNPTYQAVCSHQTGHAEAVTLVFDPNEISYQTLLQLFFDNHDPTTRNQQGPDIGSQYRSVIFYHSKDQQDLALKTIASLTAAKKFANPIVTEVLPATDFYPAEEYHQQYIRKQTSCR